jgi:hypothetical protein
VCVVSACFGTYEPHMKHVLLKRQLLSMVGAEAYLVQLAQRFSWRMKHVLLKRQLLSRVGAEAYLRSAGAARPEV